jgi:hypothetical protein
MNYGIKTQSFGAEFLNLIFCGLAMIYALYFMFHDMQKCDIILADGSIIKS